MSPQTARKSTGSYATNNQPAQAETTQVRVRKSTPTRLGVGRGKGGIRRIRRVVERERRLSEELDQRIRESINPLGETQGLRERETRREESLHRLRRLQFRGEKENDIPMHPFALVVKEIASAIKSDGCRFQMAAMHALRDACEEYMVRFFEHCSMYTAHAKRVTLMTKDVELFKRINSVRASSHVQT